MWGKRQRNLELLSDRQFERAKLVHENATADIENIKTARVNYANYSVLISAGLLGVAQLFATDQTIRSNPVSVMVFFAVLAVTAVGNAATAQVIQRRLRAAMRKARERLFDANTQLAIDVESTDEKMRKDQLIIRGLIGAPWVATLVLLIYLALKVPVPG